MMPRPVFICCTDDGTCYIPAAFLSQTGKALDDKTPLLRSNDAVNREGLRLLGLLGGFEDTRQVVTYLGWEQEFFIVSREAFLKRPDLVATGRTLLGAPPTRGQQMDQHYFGPVPGPVKACLDDVQAALLRIGCPLNVYHNEVAPSQHEISPFFTISNVSADLNQIAMQLCVDIGAKHGLVFLFHEKPFAGLNGSGKHNNWSVGTDTGVNFFSPGKTAKEAELFAASVACLAYALDEHNAVVRASVAHAGNDHRLGAQEAPSAIISLSPGSGVEERIKAIMAGGALTGHLFGADAAAAASDGSSLNTLECGAAGLNPLQRGAEDRNRTAPFPYVGNNRFEFRSVGSSQHCGFPLAVVNAAFADGLRHLCERLERGEALRDAVASMYTAHGRAIFCGDNYSPDWPVEAAKRGLPHLRDAVSAASALASPAAKALFARTGVLGADEADARAEMALEAYASTIEAEAATLLRMVRTGVEPALAADLAAYATAQPAGFAPSERYAKRRSAYDACSDAADALEASLESIHVLASNSHGGGAVKYATAHDRASYAAYTLKPHLASVRAACDAAEVLVRAGLWPFPPYAEVLYAHHFASPGRASSSPGL